MSVVEKLRSGLMYAAEAKVGAPFRHHYKPNKCEGGRITIESCMEYGMDNLGYDCSGLVIRSLCDVIGINPKDWPMEFRHSYQLNSFASSDPVQTGDITLIESQSKDGYRYNTHMGIQSDGDALIHASGKSQLVERSTPMGIIIAKRSLDTIRLLEAISLLKERP